MKISPIQILLVAIWLGLIVYAFGFAPPDAPNPNDRIINLVLGKDDPAAVAVFNLLGLIPLLYFFLLIPDGHGQKLPGWPFGLLSFGVGAFGLMPYLFLRRPHSDWPQARRAGWIVRLFDSHWFALAVSVGILILIYFGLSRGDWNYFWEQWRTVRFIHVMTLDFVLLSLLLPVLLKDDMRRRGIRADWIFWAVSLVPLFGTLVYLVTRPKLTTKLIPGQNL